MITTTQMYWIMRLDSIRACGALFGGLSIILGLGLLLLTVGMFITGDEECTPELASMFARAWRYVCGISVYLASLLFYKMFFPYNKGDGGYSYSPQNCQLREGSASRKSVVHISG